MTTDEPTDRVVFDRPPQTTWGDSRVVSGSFHAPSGSVRLSIEGESCSWFSFPCSVRDSSPFLDGAYPGMIDPHQALGATTPEAAVSRELYEYLESNGVVVWPERIPVEPSLRPCNECGGLQTSDGYRLIWDGGDRTRPGYIWECRECEATEIESIL